MAVVVLLGHETVLGAIWNLWIVLTVRVCDSCRMCTGSTVITVMAAKGSWIEAGLLMCWTVNVAQLCGTDVLKLFVC